MKRLALVAIAVFAVGCRDQQLLQPQPGGPAALIMDGAHNGGNEHFFFLPPLVADPDAFFDAGTFNPGVPPVAEVCTLTDDPRLALVDCVVGAPLVFGPEAMALDLPSEQYRLLWDTKVSPLLVPGAFYRVRVRAAVEGSVLGFLDLNFVDEGMKNLRSGEVVLFQDGRTLPIKVRIEQGAFGATNPDHVERVVSNRIPTATLDVTTNTGFAGARFADDWLPRGALAAGIDRVVVVIERISVNDARVETSCLESGLKELEGCYRFRTDPDLTEFGAFFKSVIAGICVEIPIVENPDAEPFQMHRRRESEGAPTGETFALPSAAAPFLTCADFTRTPPPPPPVGLRRGGGVLELARAGWHALARGIERLVTPRALYAVDLGAGGSTEFFSRFGWARAATMLKVPITDNQIAVTGTKVPLDPRVCLVTVHHEPRSLVGEPVTFTVTRGGGTVGGGTSAVARTGSDGCASAPWVLGSTTAPAGNRLTASAAASPSTVEFAATAAGTVVNVAVNSFAIDLAAGRMQNPTGVSGSVSFNDTQVFFGAGFAYATSATDILVGYKTANQDSDFDPAAPVVVVSESPHHTTAEVRPGPDLAGIAGVTVTQESFAFSNTADAGYVLLKYTLTNSGVDPVSNVFAGLVVDPDLLFSESHLDDVAAFNRFVSVAEVTEGDQESHPQVIGIVPIVSPDTTRDFFAWVNGGDPGDPTTNAEYFPRLSAGLPEGSGSEGPADIRFVTGVGPFSIPGGGMRVVWFALVGGDDRTVFEANVAAARAKIAAGGL